MLDSLYENIGDKIKNWAKWIFIVEAIGAIITGIILATAEDILYIFIAIGGPIIAWVGSWILYAFGELVADTHAIRHRMYLTPEEKDMQDTERKVARENEIKAKQQAIENVQREAEEKKKHEAEEKAKRDAIEKAKRDALKGKFTLIPMDRPAKFTHNDNFARQIKELPIDELYKNYLNEDEWTAEYRYMCYLELKKRLG